MTHSFHFILEDNMQTKTCSFFNQNYYSIQMDEEKQQKAEKLLEIIQEISQCLNMFTVKVVDT